MTGGTDGDIRAATRTGRSLAYVIVNPSKSCAIAAVCSLLEDGLCETGYAEPAWLGTSVSEPGMMQACLALAAGTNLVMAAGGGGTVRSVAAGLAGADAQMGIIPSGATNLATRSLGVPVGDARTTTRVVAYGIDLPADPAWVRIEPWSDPGALPGPIPPGDLRGWADSVPPTPLTGQAAATLPDSLPILADPADSR